MCLWMPRFIQGNLMLIWLKIYKCFDDNLKYFDICQMLRSKMFPFLLNFWRVQTFRQHFFEIFQSNKISRAFCARHSSNFSFISTISTGKNIKTHKILLKNFINGFHDKKPQNHFQQFDFTSFEEAFINNPQLFFTSSIASNLRNNSFLSTL